MKKINKHPHILTISEQILFERFAQYDKIRLTPATQDVLNDYKDHIFIQDIFAIVVEDVFKALSITEWDETSYRKLMDTAKEIYEMTGCFFQAEDQFLFALPIVWISHCCRYKETISILTSEPKPHSIVKDAMTLQYSLCAQFFNIFAGPAFGKAKVLEKYMFTVYGQACRGHKNNNHLLNFETLLHFTSLTGFSYVAPENRNINLEKMRNVNGYLTK